MQLSSMPMTPIAATIGCAAGIIIGNHLAKSGDKSTNDCSEPNRVDESTLPHARFPQKQNRLASIKLPAPHNQTVEVSVLNASREETVVLDLSTLPKKPTIITFDAGLKHTSSIKTSVSDVQGKQGILLYRNHNINEIIETGATFLETVRILMHDVWPDQKQCNRSQIVDLKRIQQTSPLTNELKSLIDNHAQLHPMTLLQSSLPLLKNEQPIANMANSIDRIRAAELILKKVPQLIAAQYQTRLGNPIVEPRSDLSYSANFLYMMFNTPEHPFEPTNDQIDLLDRLLILHAEHGLNASTYSLLSVISTKADTYAAVSAAIGSLSGSAHGGANEAVMHMLRNDIQSINDIDHFLEIVKDKQNRKPLMGFGHREYQTIDPRATIMKKICSELFDQEGRIAHPLWEKALALESAAGQDSYFVDRNLKPNVDYFSGMALETLGIPVEFFPTIFALSRIAGWLAHVEEAYTSNQLTLVRPKQIPLD